MTKNLSLKEKLIVLASQIEAAHHEGSSADKERKEFFRLKEGTEFSELSWSDWLGMVEDADESIFN